MIKKTGTEESKVTKKKVVAKKAVSKKTVAKKAAASKPAVTKKVPAVKKAAPVAKKAPVTKKKVATKPVVKPAVSDRERYEMVATMAYYRAEQRNFAPGNEQQDWFECEQIVDEMLKNR